MRIMGQRRRRPSGRDRGQSMDSGITPPRLRQFPFRSSEQTILYRFPWRQPGDADCRTPLTAIGWIYAAGSQDRRTMLAAFRIKKEIPSRSARALATGGQEKICLKENRIEA